MEEEVEEVVDEMTDDGKEFCEKRDDERIHLVLKKEKHVDDDAEKETFSGLRF